MNKPAPYTLFLAPSGSGVGLTTLALGMVRALDVRGVRVAFCKPIGQSLGHDQGPERSTHFIRSTTHLIPADPIPQEEAARLISAGEQEQLMERVVALFHQSAAGADVVVVEGIVHSEDWPSAASINPALAQTLSARVILAGKIKGESAADFADFESRMELSIREFGGLRDSHILGCLINHTPESLGGPLKEIRDAVLKRCPLFSRVDFPIIGTVPEHSELSAPRTVDVARHLDAAIINEGEMATRRVRDFTLLARTVPNMLGRPQARQHPR